MKTQTQTEKLIIKAVSEAKKEIAGSHISNCNITMNMQADGATKILAEAILAQAKANEENSLAINQMAKTLKPINVCGINITSEGAGFGETNNNGAK